MSRVPWFGNGEDGKVIDFPRNVGGLTGSGKNGKDVEKEKRAVKKKRFWPLTTCDPLFAQSKNRLS